MSWLWIALAIVAWGVSWFIRQSPTEGLHVRPGGEGTWLLCSLHDDFSEPVYYADAEAPFLECRLAFAEAHLRRETARRARVTRRLSRFDG